MTLPLIEHDLDLTAALSEALRAVSERQRGDETNLRVSDLAKCELEVWARRNGKPRIRPSAAGQLKMEYGLIIERQLAQYLLEPLRAQGWELHEAEQTQWQGVTGHIDFLLVHAKSGERRVVEVKTTTFFPKEVTTGEVSKTTGRPIRRRVREIPADTQEHYKIQAAGYALSVGCDRFAVVVLCRESGLFAQYPGPGAWYLAQDFREHVEALAQRLGASTAPGAPPPATVSREGVLYGEPPAATYKKDGTSWACAYCSFGGCSRNTNADALEMR